MDHLCSTFPVSVFQFTSIFWREFCALQGAIIIQVFTPNPRARRGRRTNRWKRPSQDPAVREYAYNTLTSSVRVGSSLCFPHWRRNRLLTTWEESKKLASKFPGHFENQRIVTPAALRLKLPGSTCIHPTFHLSKPVGEGPPSSLTHHR